MIAQRRRRSAHAAELDPGTFALAELLDERLMTVDRRLAAAARDHAGVTVVEPV